MKFGLVICILITIFGLLCGWLIVSSFEKKQKESEGSHGDDLPRPIAVQHLPNDKALKPRKTEGESGASVRNEDTELRGEKALSKGEVIESNTTVSEMDEKSYKQALSNPDLPPAALSELQELFANGAAGGLEDRKFMQSLSCYKPGAVLSAAMSSMKFGNASEKENALWAVGMLFGKESATGMPFEALHTKAVIVGGDGSIADASTQTKTDGNGSALPGDAEQTVGGQESSADMDSHDLIATVSAGLFDANSDVRDTAFDVMSVLPDETRGVLAANLLSEGDVALQERLMASVEGSDADADLRISLMGLGSENESVRTLAAANLKNAAGREFSDQHEASEWFDAHSQQEFLQDAGNTNQ